MTDMTAPDAERVAITVKPFGELMRSYVGQVDPEKKKRLEAQARQFAADGQQVVGADFVTNEIQAALGDMKPEQLMDRVLVAEAIGKRFKDQAGLIGRVKEKWGKPEDELPGGHKFTDIGDYLKVEAEAAVLRYQGGKVKGETLVVPGGVNLDVAEIAEGIRPVVAEKVIIGDMATETITPNNEDKTLVVREDSPRFTHTDVVEKTAAVSPRGNRLSLREASQDAAYSAREAAVAAEVEDLPRLNERVMTEVEMRGGVGAVPHQAYGGKTAEELAPGTDDVIDAEFRDADDVGSGADAYKTTGSEPIVVNTGTRENNKNERGRRGSGVDWDRVREHLAAAGIALTIDEIVEWYEKVKRGENLDPAFIAKMQEAVKSARQARKKAGSGTPDVPPPPLPSDKDKDKEPDEPEGPDYGGELEKGERVKVREMSFGEIRQKLGRLAELRAMRELKVAYPADELSNLARQENRLTRQLQTLYDTAKYGVAMFDDDPQTLKPDELIGDRVTLIVNDTSRDDDVRSMTSAHPQADIDRAKVEAFMHPLRELGNISEDQYWRIFLAKVEASGTSPAEGKRLVAAYRRTFGGMMRYYKEQGEKEHHYAELLALEAQVGHRKMVPSERLRMVTLRNELKLLQLGGTFLHENTAQRGRWYVEVTYAKRIEDAHKPDVAPPPPPIVPTRPDRGKRGRLDLYQNYPGLRMEDYEMFEKGDSREAMRWVRTRLQTIIKTNGGVPNTRALESFADWVEDRWNLSSQEILATAEAEMREGAKIANGWTDAQVDVAIAAGTLGGIFEEARAKELDDWLKANKDVTAEEIARKIGELGGGALNADKIRASVETRRKARGLEKAAEYGVDIARLEVFGRKFEATGKPTIKLDGVLSMANDSDTVFGGEKGLERMKRIWGQVEVTFRTLESDKELIREYLNAKFDAREEGIKLVEDKIKVKAGITDDIQLREALQWWMVTGRAGYWDARLPRASMPITQTIDEQGREWWTLANYNGMRWVKGWAKTFGRGAWAWDELKKPFSGHTMEMYDTQCPDFMSFMTKKETGKISVEDPNKFIFEDKDWAIDGYKFWMSSIVFKGTRTKEALNKWGEGDMTITAFANVPTVYENLDDKPNGGMRLAMIMKLWRETLWEERKYNGTWRSPDQRSKEGALTTAKVAEKLSEVLKSQPSVNRTTLLLEAKRIADEYWTWEKGARAAIAKRKEEFLLKGRTVAYEDMGEQLAAKLGSVVSNLMKNLK